MTEVDVSIPESSTLSTTLQTREANVSNNIENERTQHNGSSSDNSSNNNAGNNKDIAMELDGIDTEEDDSQITSSTENGGVDNIGRAEIGKKLTQHDDSSNAFESVSQNCDSAPKTGEESVESVNSLSEKAPSQNDEIENDDTNTNDSQAKKSIITEADDGFSQGESNQPKSTNHVEDTSNDHFINSDDPLKVPKSQKENGAVNAENKLQADGGVVDLGDDSDVEMSEMPNSAPNTESCKKETEDNDSDGAVLIGSDSENENDKQPAKTAKAKTAEVFDDEDDDDCVVIEDDNSNTNDLTKRKMDIVAEDSQPPSKRHRNNLAPIPGQISIKDARTLSTPPVVQETCKRTSENVYPVNITPAGSGPPKLVPVGTPIPATSAPVVPFAGLTSLSTTPNTNILPGLTDEMFVLEAPSFIVPYIYEKPPSEQIKEIVKEIESKFSFTKEDFDEVDNADEFDMMTEQNKEDRDEETKKKKKRRRDDGDDESWSEEEEESEDDDDDDSESGMRTKVLIKEATDDITAIKGAIKPVISTATATAGNDGSSSKTTQENYFESPLGKFFMDIGVGLVQEFVQNDLIRLQKRKMRKSLGRNTSEFEKAIAALTANMEASKKKNSPFKFNMKRCEFCNFKSESALAMANHYETPHMNGVLYKCNFCIFEIRNATEIVYHMEAVHNIKARLIKPLPYHQCPNCGFEDNGKAKLARHQPVCAKKFRPEINMAPPSDWEAPAKIPRLKPRHGLVATATAYQAMAAQAAAQKAALASIQQQQQARNLQAAALAAQNAANKLRGRTPATPATKTTQSTGAMMRAANQVRNPAATNVVLPNNYQLGAGGQIIQSPVGKKTSGQPSISITPLPRQTAGGTTVSSPSTSKVPPAGIKPGQNPAGNKAQFVICEICDGYIKDLEQLRNHMQWMHKVKVRQCSYVNYFK